MLPCSLVGGNMSRLQRDIGIYCSQFKDVPPQSWYLFIRVHDVIPGNQQEGYKLI